MAQRTSPDPSLIQRFSRIKKFNHVSEGSLRLLGRSKGKREVILNWWV